MDFIVANPNGSLRIGFQYFFLSMYVHRKLLEMTEIMQCNYLFIQMEVSN